jgi:hypothetical protein
LRTPSFCDAIKGSESYYFCGFIQPLSNVERLPQGCNKPIKNRSFFFWSPEKTSRIDPFQPQPDKRDHLPRLSAALNQSMDE